MDYLNFEMEVKNIYMLMTYNINDSEIVTVIINWLACECCLVVQTLTDEEQEICKSRTVLSTTLSAKFKPQHNESIPSLPL